MKMGNELENSQLYNTICSYLFTVFIFNPQGVTDKSKTLNDDIFFNNFEFSTISSDIIDSISDHIVILEFCRYHASQIFINVILLTWIITS